jgi:hypothetical protein
MPSLGSGTESFTDCVGVPGAAKCFTAHDKGSAFGNRTRCHLTRLSTATRPGYHATCLAVALLFSSFRSDTRPALRATLFSVSSLFRR